MLTKELTDKIDREICQNQPKGFSDLRLVLDKHNLTYNIIVKQYYGQKQGVKVVFKEDNRQITIPRMGLVHTILN